MSTCLNISKEELKAYNELNISLQEVNRDFMENGIISIYFCNRSLYWITEYLPENMKFMIPILMGARVGYRLLYRVKINYTYHTICCMVSNGLFDIIYSLLGMDNKMCMKCFKRSGGYIAANIHNITSEVPPENVVAMFDAAIEFRDY